MKANTFRRLLCGVLAAVMLCPAAMAEGLDSDDVSGLNPFSGEYIAPSAAPDPAQAAINSNPFGGADLTANGGTVTADDLFGGNTSYTVDPNSELAAVASNPFATGTASATPNQPIGGASAVTNDPFGTGSAGTAANDPFGTGSAGTASNDPFGTGSAGTASNDPFGTGSAGTAANDPFGTGSASTANSDPFGTGAAADADADSPDTEAAGAAGNPFADGGTDADTAAEAGGNPFGDVVTPQVTAAPTKLPTVSGYNPFSSGTEQPMQATPAGTVMYVSGSIARLRQKPSDEAKVITAAYFGQQLNVTATQNEWAQVQNPANGRTLYCLLEGLSSTDPNTMSKQMYAQLPTTPVSKSPAQRAVRLRNLKKGDAVTVTAITDDGLWARVTADGTTFGFVPTIYLDDTPAAAEGTPVWCGTAYTGVMVNPDRWTQITTLCFGQSCYLVAYINNNTIAKIRSAKGYVAYCDAGALVTADPATQSATVYVQATGKFLGKKAGDTGDFFNVNKNSQLMLLGVDSSGTWALVRRGRQKLYIPALYLGPTRLGNEKRNLVVIQDTSLYSNSLPGASSLGTLPLGTRLQLIGGTNTHAQVATISDGFSQPVTGYVSFEYLRAE